MIVFLNGQFVPEEKAVISVFDRGFLYGDGLFEAFRICRGKPFLWEQHMRRLQQGIDLLKLPMPYTSGQLREHAAELIRQNEMPDSILRLIISRGIGARGYSPKGADHPSVVMSLHPAPVIDPGHPPQWTLITSSVRLPANDPLTQSKTCNKLSQVLARSEADAHGANEALLLATSGEVAEASSSNLFWIEHGTVCTPPLAGTILPGVTRAMVLELCERLNIPAMQTTTTPGKLLQSQGVFLSLSSWGIVEAVTLDGNNLQRSPLLKPIRDAYNKALEEHSGLQA
ncbi:aminotransferase class IV [Pedosphaera parvula]|uniref:aminodeoxychorismate lyase n=1 Tax=Pedosphaera parvula (strain Ellin514) TaxID=320771 RepID=B9XIW9_PEDPL|nr:aminotransferase class IV [Pedosphaera parvula]EEF60196.1 aminodeoxychorismate lyase [Pedosphaera parvula Ellin514]